MDEKIVRGWLKSSFWAEANVALRADDWIGIDVDHYGDKLGQDELTALEQQLGQLPSTITSTARGADSPSRIHFYTVPPGLSFRSRLSPSIEVIQRTHRYAVVHPSYHPTTGTQYEWYDYEGNALWGLPSLSDFEALPQAWVEHLTVQSVDEHEGFPGPIGAWVETLVPGEPSNEVRDLMDSLPTDGFTHDDVTRITWHLVALGAEGHPGVPEALARIEQTWVKPPYDTLQYRRELEAAIDGAVKKRGALEVPDIKPMIEVRYLIENSSDINLYTQLHLDEDRFLKSALKDLYSRGAQPEDILSLIMGTQTGQNMHVSQVWRAILDYQPLAIKVDDQDKIHLLTEEEEALVRRTPNFIQEYCDVAVLREKYPNLPYHRMNAWTALSLALSDKAHVMKEEGRMGLNLNVLILGDSGTGKGLSKSQLRDFLKLALGVEEFATLNLGGNPSPEALHGELLKRDGGVQWFNTDEADQLLVKLNGVKANYSDGLQGMLTDFYEGHVPPMLRRSDPNSGKSGSCNLIQWLMGTPSSVLPLLRPKQVESGFLARYLTAFGDPPRMLPDSLRPRLATSEAALRSGFSPYVQALAEDYITLLGTRSTVNQEPMTSTDDVLDRIGQANVFMHDHFRKHRNYEAMLRPCLVRISDSILKATALIALSEGRHKMVMSDALIALHAAQEWLENLMLLIDGIQSNEWSLLVDKVYAAISKRKRIPTFEVSRQFADLSPKDLAMVIQSLTDQKLITRTKDAHYEVIDSDDDD